MLTKVWSLEPSRKDKQNFGILYKLLSAERGTSTLG